MKKILFIGDLRTANNYGAVATTESLMHLIEQQHLNAEFKYIDFRSFYNPTPANGFTPINRNNDSVVKSLLRYVKRSIPKDVKDVLKRILMYKPSIVPDFVPYKYSQYEDYYANMVSGKSLIYEKKMLEWADVIYVNSEGNIVNGTDSAGKYRMGARYLLFLAWIAKVKMNKPTLIVNHTVDPNNYNAFEIIENLYPKLDKVFVRETLSLPLLERHGVTNAQFVPDALFSYKPSIDWKPSAFLLEQIDFSKPYICIGDSSGFLNSYNKVKWDVKEVLGEIIDRLKNIIPQIIFVDGYNGGNEDVNYLIRKKCHGYVNITNCSYHDLYHVLEKSTIFISGRWHASILSVLSSTPILLWGADSHKTKSLYTLLDYPYRFFEVSTLPVNIDELIDEAHKIIQNRDSVSSAIKKKVDEYAKMTYENAKVLNEYV